VRTKPGEARDGIPAEALGVQHWLAFAAPAVIRTFDRGSGQAAKDREIALHSPVLAVLGTDADEPRAWLHAGQALESVLLEAHAEGLCASFMNQPIEVPDYRAQLGALLGREGFPQLLLRLGHGSPVEPTPRRLLRDVLMRQSVPYHSG
jgi:hypothetical protein